ncbi:DCC1-like thiol-disulfide oxidoreductase family protein [Halomonas salinarum]|uniref:DCC1-like thiol-disulfide oxidoreductase family protein n=1 Tax=Halomonas salinarum TaxID=1158993 RepID=UPI00143905C5|nr:DCC1-like thiol-disulfide oxidoreductase family protein [Halomonas salinarum]
MASKTDNLLVYDGQCPFCRRYVRWLQLQDAAEELRLIDARGDDPVIDELRSRGFDLNKGMVLKLDAQWYHGADALRVLALLSSPVGVFNRLNRRLFGGHKRAESGYPLLRGLRRLALWVLRRPPLQHSSRRRNTRSCRGGEDDS